MALPTLRVETFTIDIDDKGNVNGLQSETSYLEDWISEEYTAKYTQKEGANASKTDGCSDMKPKRYTEEYTVKYT